jgi:hypothetical protein
MRIRENQEYSATVISRLKAGDSRSRSTELKIVLMVRQATLHLTLEP